MSNKPPLKNFLQVNSKAFNFKDRPEGLVYKDTESEQLYKEPNAFSNRLKVEIPFALFGVIMYILSVIKPQWAFWSFGIYITIICATIIFLLSFALLRYYFTKFEPIKKKKEADGTGYKQIEFALIIVPAVMLFLI